MVLPKFVCFCIQNRVKQTSLSINLSRQLLSETKKRRAESKKKRSKSAKERRAAAAVLSMAVEKAAVGNAFAKNAQKNKQRTDSIPSAVGRLAVPGTSIELPGVVIPVVLPGICVKRAVIPSLRTSPTSFSIPVARARDLSFLCILFVSKLFLVCLSGPDEAPRRRRSHCKCAQGGPFS